MAEIKAKNRLGTTIYYIDDHEIKEKNQLGNTIYFIDGTLTRNQLYSLISII